MSESISSQFSDKRFSLADVGLYNQTIDAEGEKFMTSEVRRFNTEQCIHEDKQLGDVDKWKKGFEMYKKCMNDKDRVLFEQKCMEFGLQSVLSCWSCLNSWMKHMGNEMKRCGNRATPIFIFFLDLYALGDWVQYNDKEVEEAARVFLEREQPDKEIFKGDKRVVEQFNDFCSEHCRLEGKPSMTLSEWLEGKGWANHGTASDVNAELFKNIKDVKRDKAALAYTMTGDELHIPEVLDNAVFPKRDRKQRIIVVGSTSEYILGSYVNKTFSEMVETHSFKISNTSKVQNINEIISNNILSGNINMPIDQSAFDHNQTKELVLAARDFIIKSVMRVESDQRLGKLLTSGVETISVKGNLLGYWERGLCSGKWYTSLVGSLLNAFEVWKMNGDSWSGIIIPTLHQGDDAQVCTADENVVKNMLRRAKEMNIPVNPTKNFIDRFRTDYLHTMFMAGPARVQFGDSDMVAKIQILRYPARSVTSIMWGDQEQQAASTTAITQSTTVRKRVERIFGVVTRLNNNCSKLLIEKVGLSQLEKDFATTPIAMGGMGVRYIDNRGGGYAKAKGGKRSITLGVVKGFGGYDKVIRQTEQMFGVRFDHNEVAGLIESTMKFKNLPDKQSAMLRKMYYDIVPIPKGEVMKLKNDKHVFTRNVDNPSQKLPLQPFLSQRPPWAAAVSLLLGVQRLWDAASHVVWSRLRRAGPYVWKLWERGEISVSSPLSRRLSPDLQSRSAQTRSQQLMLYLVNHRGKDISPLRFKQLSYEIENLLLRECETNAIVYSSR